MLKCFFTDLQNITMSELNSSTHSIKAAVAWINFSYYEPIFINLLRRGVKIEIIVNDDGNNRKYMDIINNLIERGAKIKLLRTAGIMHHKFCVIDNCRCMFGSFNWTDNANIRNIEDLNITDELPAVYNFRLEFNALWDLSKADLSKLRKPDLCKTCKMPIINIMFMEQEGDYQAKVEIMQQCNCNQRIIYTDYYDISLYNNCLGIYEYLEDEIIEAQQNNDEISYNQLISQQDFLISNYLSLVRTNRMGCSIIHGVGVKAWRWFNKHEGEYYYKIIWKERNTSSYIDDEYDIMV